jgi:hypothetical protein
MNRFVCFTAALALACSTAFASLSGNLVLNGDFEDAASVKEPGLSPRTQAEINASAPALNESHFHPGGVAGTEPNPANQIIPPGTEFTDLGRWFAPFGGITAWDDPRAAYNLGNEVAGINRSNIGGAQGHVLESVAFRGWASVIVAAPDNMVAGPAQLDFDFYYTYWDTVYADTAQIMQPVVHGIQAADLPTAADRFSAWNGDEWLYGNSSLTQNWDLIYAGVNFNSQQHEKDVLNPGNAEIPFHATPGPQWQAYSDGWTQTVPTGYVAADKEQEEVGSWDYDGQFVIDETYDYFILTFRMLAYSEPHPYSWLLGGQPSDNFFLAIDNVSLQVSVEAGLPGDFNGDAVVNTEDINPFILALTDPAGFATAFPDVDPLAADPNGDSLINTEDMNPFIALLTGGGEATIIPEPASLALLGMGALALMRRRR